MILNLNQQCFPAQRKANFGSWNKKLQRLDYHRPCIDEQQTTQGRRKFSLTSTVLLQRNNRCKKAGAGNL